MTMNKKEIGQYFTRANPFHHTAFLTWFEKALNNNNKNAILEPFAGANHIPFLIEEATKQKLNWECYDIDPSVIDKNISEHKIIIQDVFEKFPKNHHIAITNPPYLAKNTATRLNLKYPTDITYDNLYKYSLECCLKNTKYLAAIIPESFIVQNLFLNRLEVVISLTNKMFEDTEFPVCLALFSPEKESSDFDIYSGDIFLGSQQELTKNKIFSTVEYDLTFNDPHGEIAVFAVDNNKNNSIYFALGSEISPEKIKHTSRASTKIKLNKCFTTEDINSIIKVSNELLTTLRETTHDVFLTAFKGLRKDGKYRRRLDFKQIRTILNSAIYSLDQTKK